MKQESFFAELERTIQVPVRQRRPSTRTPRDPSEAPKAKPTKDPTGRFPIYAAPCTGCPLESYKKILGVAGDLQTCRIIVILDRPSVMDIVSQRVASDRKVTSFYEKALGRFGITPDQICYINALRCSCHDRELKTEEINRCGSYLLKDLTSSPCNLVLCSSLTAVSYLFDGTSLRTFRGRVLEFHGKQVLCTQEQELIQKDPVQEGLFANDMERLSQIILGTYKKPELHYSSLHTEDEIVDLCEHLIKTFDPANPLGWDIETMWLKSISAYAFDCYAEPFRIWQMAIAWEDYVAAGFPFCPDPHLAKKFNLPSIETHPRILPAVTKLLECTKIIEHTKFDARCVSRYGISVGRQLPLQQFEDTHAMNFLINPEDMGGNDLKSLAWEYTTEGGYEDGIGGVDSLDEFDWEKNCHYNCHDADLTRRLFHLLMPKVRAMQQEPVYEKLLKPINCAVLEMEIDGIQIDADFMREQQKIRKTEMEVSLATFKEMEVCKKFVAYCIAQAEKYQKAVDQNKEQKKSSSKEGKQAEKMLRKYGEVKTPEDFEVKNEHLSILLYEVLRIPVTKTTGKGDPSTEADILEANTKTHSFLNYLIEFKKAQKLYGTYISPYLDGKFSKGKIPVLENPPHIKHDGKAHPTIKPTGAQSGRSSCENPNGQNIKNEYEAKRPFISRFKGGNLISADYSQAEIRIAAVQCKDPMLVKALNFDIHWINLALVEKFVTEDEAMASLLGSYEQGAAFSKKCIDLIDATYGKLAREQVEKTVQIGDDPEGIEKEIEKSLKQLKKTKRTIAKSFMFGPMYGQGEWGATNQLVLELGLDREEAGVLAKSFLKTLHKLYAAYFKWAESNIPLARKNNYVESIFGRRRPMNYAVLLKNLAKGDDEIKSQLGALDRKATNTKVQGPASDLCLLAAVHMIEIFKNKRISPDQTIKEKLMEHALNGKFLKRCIAAELITETEFEDFLGKCMEGKALTRTILPIHDNLISDSPEEETVAASVIINAVMVNTAEYYISTSGVAFDCDIEIGPNLGDVKPFTP